jgi:phospholipid transport system substrate-binding protein
MDHVAHLGPEYGEAATKHQIYYITNFAVQQIPGSFRRCRVDRKSGGSYDQSDFRSLHMRHLFIVATLAATFCTSASVAQAQGVDPAQSTVKALDDGLITIMKAGKAAGTKGRAATIGPVIDRAYDLALMTRLSIGSSWTTIKPADQAAVTAAFRRMTIGQYANNFKDFSGQSFTIEPKVEVRGGDRLVRTTLNDPKGEKVSISYRLRNSGGAWKIIDVFYRNAISQLAIRRSDFAGVFQSGGAKALVDHLDALSAKSGG